jgi:hypothetical protein
MKHSAGEPMVGIFWLFQRRLVIDCAALCSAESYGDCATHPRGHFPYWTMLQKSGQVPMDVDYEELPRGRVVFDKHRDRFVLLADPCILNRSELVKRIISRLRLPLENTDIDRDPHYRCSKCLNRSLISQRHIE